MAAEPWSGELPQSLASQFGERVLALLAYREQNFARVLPDAVIPVIEYLKSTCGFDFLVDLTAVDHGARAPRFELVYILYSFSRNERVRVHTAFAEDWEPRTATRLYPGANWLEREVFDMFGIRFADHPNMRRMLLPDEWTGHPLRKDYSILQMDQAWVQANLGIESGQ